MNIKQVIKSDMRFKSGAVEAVRSFRERCRRDGCTLAKIDRATAENESDVRAELISQRFAHMESLLEELSKVYVVITPQLVHESKDHPMACALGCYEPFQNRITMFDRLSIITLLHEFAHHIKGCSERVCIKWSVNLFDRAYPGRVGRLNPHNHLLRVS